MNKFLKLYVIISPCLIFLYAFSFLLLFYHSPLSSVQNIVFISTTRLYIPSMIIANLLFVFPIILQSKVNEQERRIIVMILKYLSISTFLCALFLVHRPWHGDGWGEFIFWFFNIFIIIIKITKETVFWSSIRPDFKEKELYPGDIFFYNFLTVYSSFFILMSLF